MPNSWNLSQRSLFSRRHSTLSSSVQLHLGLSNSAQGLGADDTPSLAVDGEGDGDGDRHDGEGDSDLGLSNVVSDSAVEHRLSSIEASELGGLL